MTAHLPELLEALDAVRRRIADLRWELEEGARARARVLDQLREAERELDELRFLLQRPPAAPPSAPKLRRRRSA